MIRTIAKLLDDPLKFVLEYTANGTRVRKAPKKHYRPKLNIKRESDILYLIAGL